MDVNGKPPSDDINNIMARVPYPSMNRFSILAVSDGVIDFDSFQISTRINRNGLNGTAYYSYQDSFGDGGGSFGRPDEDPEAFTIQTNNAANPKGEYGRISRKHTFRTFYVYDLPFFKASNSIGAKIAGGWKLSGNLSFSSGSPLDIILGFDANHDGITSQPRDRPDLVGEIKYTSGSRAERMASFFDK